MYREAYWLTTLLTAVCAFGAVPKGVDLALLNGWDIVIVEDAISSDIYTGKKLQK